MALKLPTRTRLGVFPTPLQRDPSLSDALGISDLWVKRDDLTGFSWGGNKVRAAEFLIGDALERAVTDIVVSGGPSSNFAAIMAAAGRTVGIAIHQVAYGSEPTIYPPALRSSVQAGAKLVFTGSTDRNTMEITAERLADTLCTSGRTAIAIPRGGATIVGAMGFVAAAIELAEQLDHAKLSGVTIVIPVGSGGSVSGLLAGRDLLDANWSILGASVSRPAETLAGDIVAKATKTASAVGRSPQYSSHSNNSDSNNSHSNNSDSNNFRLVDSLGDGFGTVTEDEAEFGQYLRDTTGLLIDRTYNTKPLRWLSQEAPKLSGPIIYWLTGSSLGTFADEQTPTPPTA